MVHRTAPAVLASGERPILCCRAMRTGSHRATGLLLALGFLGGWITASWVSPPAVTTQAPPARPRPAPPAVDIPRVALHRVRVPDATPKTSRNPFVFRERAVAPAAAARPASEPADAAPATAPVPAADGVPSLPWRLVGLAHGSDGAAPTAILSGRGDIHLVTPGDRLPDGSEVVSIEGTRLVLRLPDGASRTLDLP